MMDAYCNNEEGELALEGEVHLEAGILTWDMNKLYGIDGKEFKSESFYSLNIPWPLYCVDRVWIKHTHTHTLTHAHT